MNTHVVNDIISEINTRLVHGLRKRKQQVKVLIVEDELTHQPFWKHIIDDVSPGALINWVTSAESAEKFLLFEYERGSTYDLIILDVMLAGEKTGVDLWKRFKEAGKSFIFVSKLPIQNVKGTWNEDFLGSVPICLEKPLDANQCRKLVGQILKPKHAKRA